MITILASAVRAATTNSADVSIGGKGAELWFRVSVAPGVDTVTFSLQAKDPVSGQYLTVLTGIAENAAVVRRYRVYPGIAVAANSTANDTLPDTWRVVVTHSAATNFTYSVTAVPLQ